MNSDPIAAAREALRDRQGRGARYDAPAAPAAELGWARRGKAYFARKLNELDDTELDAPSRVPGWSRRHVIAQVGYQARALARLVESARTVREVPTYRSDEARRAEIALGATLPARALRSLIHHAAIHLNVAWRDLTDAGWDATMRDQSGRDLALRDTPFLRAREVWLRATDLGNGGSFRDFPPDLVDALIADRHAVLQTKPGGLDCRLCPTDRADAIPLGRGTGPEITGAARDLARWLCGRGAAGLESSTGALPDLPRAFLQGP